MCNRSCADYTVRKAANNNVHFAISAQSAKGTYKGKRRTPRSTRMAQEYSELDIAASDAVLIRQTLEETIPMVRQDEVRDALIPLLSLSKTQEASKEQASLNMIYSFKTGMPTAPFAFGT